MSPASKLQADKALIRATLETLFRGGDLIELRIFNAARVGTISGYFDSFELLTAAACVHANKLGTPACYVTLNPCDPTVKSRAFNRTKDRPKATTADKDILERLLLLVDFDPVRPAGISASDEEHAAALERAQQGRDTLLRRGWPAPVLADSGNGGHLVYRLALPNDDASRDLIRDALKALAAEFDDDQVKIDTGVYNAARVTKLYGTPVRKGDHTEERPHRLSRLLEVPELYQEVSRELLAELAARIREQAPPRPSGTRPRQGDFSVADWIAEHQLAVRGEPVAYRGGRKWILEECPFDSSHKAPDSAIFEQSNGAAGFKCLHNSCTDHNWQKLRERIEGPRRPARAKQPTGQRPRQGPDFDQKARKAAPEPESNQDDARDEFAWRRLLLLTDKKTPRPNLHNAVIALTHAPAWKGVLRLNRLSHRVELAKTPAWGRSGEEWGDAENGEATIWLQEHGIDVTSSTTAEAVKVVAARAAYHPIQDYLRSLRWDGESRIDSWLTDYFGAAKSTYTETVGRKWLISAVARVMRPGCKADYMLVLEGLQGVRKSMALQELAVHEEWFTDDLRDTSHEGAIQLLGKWIIEWGDMQAFHATGSQERLKGFITRRVDNIRLAYDRFPSALARQSVFVGTTNRQTYFSDPTGNRRFWPVECDARIKADALGKVRDQLWAEAVEAFDAPEQWWIEPGEVLDEVQKQQCARMETDVWFDVVEKYAAEQLDGFSIADVFANALLPRASMSTGHRSIVECGRREEVRIANILKALGYEGVREREGTRRIRIYQRPGWESKP